FESVTTLPMSEVQQITKRVEDGTIRPIDAKKRLAWEIVNLYHGKEAADKAQSDFQTQFQERGVPSDIPISSASEALLGKQLSQAMDKILRALKEARDEA